MIHYDDYNLQLIERAIRRYNNQGDYWRAKGLLEVRKEMLNAQSPIRKNCFRA
jgi:hypothetical protein